MVAPIVKFRLVPPLSKLMEEKKARLPVALQKILTTLAAEGTGYAKKLTPVDTGRLRASISWKEISWAGETIKEAQIGSNVHYAPIILGDVEPFVITVKRKKALAWVVYRGGKSKPIRPASDDVEGWKRLRKRGMAGYAKKVTHPGGQKIFEKTADHIVQRAPGVVSRIFKSEGIT